MVKDLNQQNVATNRKGEKKNYCISQLHLLRTISLLFQWYEVCPKRTGVGRVHQSMHRNGSEYTEDRNGNVKQTNSLCLPEGVDDGALRVPHHVVVPQPCLWVDGLSHRSQNTQRRSFVPAGKYMYIICTIGSARAHTHTYTRPCWPDERVHSPPKLAEEHMLTLC